MKNSSNKKHTLSKVKNKESNSKYIKRKKKEYSIKSVDNSLNLLEQFNGEKYEFGITELSSAIGLHKNNIFRLLATLENRGYIEQNQNSGNYRLGIKILELGNTYRRHTGLVKVAKPVLEKLTFKLKENSYLGIMRNKRVVYIEHANANHTLRVSSRIGQRLSPISTSIGRIMLAYSSDEEVEDIFRDNVFVKYTNKTIVDENKLLKVLYEAKKKGYTTDQDEHDQGITCIAVPVFNYENNIIAGVSVSVPTSRVDENKINTIIIPAVKDAGMEISRSIGYIPP